MSKDNLGDRMKCYEEVAKTRLMKKTPVIIRLDGKAFHTFTKGLDKPFDYIVYDTMKEVTMSLCKEVQNCRIGYTQSDEITLVLIDDATYETSAWFDNEVQKLCSVCSSIATVEFNRLFLEKYENEVKEHRDEKRLSTLKRKLFKARFDARCFNVPSKDEVINNLIWRQLDCRRNAVSSIAQTMFSSKELNGKSTKERKEMIGDDIMEEFESKYWNQLYGNLIVYNTETKTWYESIQTPNFIEEWNIMRGYLE